MCQDGTVKLWEYESGRQLQTLDLKQVEETQSSEPDKGEVTKVRFNLLYNSLVETVFCFFTVYLITI